MTEPMSPERLAEITAREAAAYPGPWHTEAGIGVVTADDTAIFDDPDVDKDDAAFIAHARQDVPALLAEVERLRDLVAQAAVRCD